MSTHQDAETDTRALRSPKQPGKDNSDGANSHQSTLTLLLLHNYRIAYTLATAHLLRKLRVKLVGIERIKRLVLDGFTPDDVPYLLARTQDIAASVQTHVLVHIRDLALGYTISQTAALLKTRASSEQSLNNSYEDLLSRPMPPVYDTAKEPIDYLPLHAFIEEQQLTGPLQNDPAWINDSKKKKNWWDARLANSLAKLNSRLGECAEARTVSKDTSHAYTLFFDFLDDAIAELNLPVRVEFDLDLLRASRAQVLSDLLALHTNNVEKGEMLLSGPTLLPPAVKFSDSSSSSPPAEAVVTPTPLAFDLNEADLVKTGASARRVLLTDLHRENLSDSGEADRNEAIFYQLIQHCGLRIDWVLKWCQALLVQGKNEKALQAATLGVTACGSFDETVLLSGVKEITCASAKSLEDVIDVLTQDQRYKEEPVEGETVRPEPVTKEQRRSFKTSYHACLKMQDVASQRLAATQGVASSDLATSVQSGSEPSSQNSTHEERQE